MTEEQMEDIGIFKIQEKGQHFVVRPYCDPVVREEGLVVTMSRIRDGYRLTFDQVYIPRAILSLILDKMNEIGNKIEAVGPYADDRKDAEK